MILFPNVTLMFKAFFLFLQFFFAFLFFTFSFLFNYFFRKRKLKKNTFVFSRQSFLFVCVFYTIIS